MKTYIAVTGIVFFLLAASHAARFLAEGSRLLTEPIFVSTTILSLGLFGWAVVLFARAIRVEA